VLVQAELMEAFPVSSLLSSQQTGRRAYSPRAEGVAGTPQAGAALAFETAALG